MHQPLHGFDRVVDPLQQDRLAAQRDAGIGQPRIGFRGLGRQFRRMRHMDAEPQRMVFPQHLHQGFGDAHGKHRRHLAAEADELDVLDRPQAAEQVVELVVGDGQGIAARQQDVANFRMRFDVCERPVPLTDRELVVAAGLADHARARAVAAIGRAETGGQEQHPVGIAVNQTRNGRVVVLAQGIVGLARHAQVFLADRDVGAA